MRCVNKVRLESLQVTYRLMASWVNQIMASWVKPTIPGASGAVLAQWIWIRRGEAPADPTKCQAQAFEEPQRSKRLKISRRMAYNEKTKAKDGKEGKDGKDGHFDVQIEVFSPFCVKFVGRS